jgi:glycosyltransferase involved in cell wall biosynthesis
VQEYAAAGFPLLLSTEVGARETFLNEGVNGFSFQKENVQELKEALKKIISLDENNLHAMGVKSHQVAQVITPGNWAKTIINVLNGYSK